MLPPERTAFHHSELGVLVEQTVQLTLGQDGFLGTGNVFGFPGVGFEISNLRFKSLKLLLASSTGLIGRLLMELRSGKNGRRLGSGDNIRWFC